MTRQLSLKWNSWEILLKNFWRFYRTINYENIVWSITMVHKAFMFKFINLYQVLDSTVFSQEQHVIEDNKIIDAYGLKQVDDACVLYCERFMEFLLISWANCQQGGKVHLFFFLWFSTLPFEDVECTSTQLLASFISSLYEWSFALGLTNSNSVQCFIESIHM